jgi:Protein of unknown function (DUF3309)
MTACMIAATLRSMHKQIDDHQDNSRNAEKPSKHIFTHDSPLIGLSSPSNAHASSSRLQFRATHRLRQSAVCRFRCRTSHERIRQRRCPRTTYSGIRRLPIEGPTRRVEYARAFMSTVANGRAARRAQPTTQGTNVRIVLLVILILLLVGALPTWPYSAGWGYYPSGGLGLVLIVLIVLAVMGVL